MARFLTPSGAVDWQAVLRIADLRLASSPPNEMRLRARMVLGVIREEIKTERRQFGMSDLERRIDDLRARLPQCAYIADARLARQERMRIQEEITRLEMLLAEDARRAA
jgi:hypothetical protein